MSTDDLMDVSAFSVTLRTVTKTGITFMSENGQMSTESTVPLCVGDVNGCGSELQAWLWVFHFQKTTEMIKSQ